MAMRSLPYPVGVTRFENQEEHWLSLLGAKHLLANHVRYTSEEEFRSWQFGHSNIEDFGVPSLFGWALDSVKLQLLFSRTGASPVAFQILVISDNLHECLNEIIDSSNIQITTLVARLLISFVMHRFGEITRGHLSKFQFGKILQMAETQLRIIWRSEEPETHVEWTLSYVN